MSGPGPGEERAPEEPGGGRPWLKLAVLVVLVGGALLAVRFSVLGEYLSRDGIGRAMDALRDAPAAPVIFVAVYATATALAVPGTILTLAGGAVFGFVEGTLYNTIAANLGANAAFLIARLLGRDAVEKVTGDRLAKLDRATRDHGFRGLLTLRLVPLVPFNALNFGAGLTAISWRAYALATLVGILPGTIVYTMFADALLAGSQEASREAFVRVAVSGGLLVLLAFLPTILKKMNVKLPGAALLVPALLLGGVGGCGAEERPDGTADLPAAEAPDSATPADGEPTPSGPAPVASVSPETATTGTAGAQSTAGDARPAGDAGSPASRTSLPDHAPFTAVLSRVVRGDRVDYAALEASRDGLDAYLETLAATTPGTLEAASEDARLAFWINAYNACMLRQVVDHYPIEPGGGLVDRVKNLVADRPANSVWQIDDVFTREHCPVAGEPRSQDEIEHEIIRPMGEPRIHFAVNCAAVSCPSLDDEAYTADELDAQLDRQVRRFVEAPRHLSVGEEDGRPVLRLNKVLDWYGEDFGGTSGLVAFLRPYLDGPARAAAEDPDVQVRFFEYDWTLNDVEG